MTKLTEVPNQGGKIVLKLFPDDFERARDAVACIEKEMASTAASPTPPHPPRDRSLTRVRMIRKDLGQKPDR